MANKEQKRIAETLKAAEMAALRERQMVALLLDDMPIEECPGLIEVAKLMAPLMYAIAEGDRAKQVEIKDQMNEHIGPLLRSGGRLAAEAMLFRIFHVETRTRNDISIAQERAVRNTVDGTPTAEDLEILPDVETP